MREEGSQVARVTTTTEGTMGLLEALQKHFDDKEAKDPEIIDGTNITFADFNLSGAHTLTTDTASLKVYSWTDGSGSSLTIQTS